MFVEWLLQQKERKDSVGLLSHTVSKDPTFPRSSDKLWLFLHYFRHEPGARSAIKIAHKEWRRLNSMQRIGMTR